MEKKVEILAYHGWGFDASFWDAWKELLPTDIVFKTANRGYFDKAFHPRFEADTKFRVVFLHSFGLHWCNSGILSKADVMVIFNGFGDFLPDAENLKTVAERGLEGMIDQFPKKPQQVLDRFYGSTFAPNSTGRVPSGSPNKVPLYEDLQALRSTRFPMIDLDFGSTMIALDGDRDKVLLQPRGADIIAPHYWTKHSRVFEGVGHALPITKTQDCWSYLCSLIPIFERYENNR